MAIITLFGAKGGVGTSLFATNLAEGFADLGRALLMDLNAIAGGDDLLLDFDVKKSWADLLTVANELTDQHLRSVITGGSDRAHLLAAPTDFVTGDPADLIRSITDWFDWIIVDVGSGMLYTCEEFREFLMKCSTQCLLVTTLDPLSLRATSRWLSALEREVASPIELIVNQWQPEHPVDPSTLAVSLGVHLGAVLPYSPHRAAHHVNYGQPIMRQKGSSYSRSVSRLIHSYRQRLANDPAVEGENLIRHISKGGKWTQVE